MTSALTPMMRQYYELKSQAGDAVLFFRMGDFYEIFGDDATKVAPLLSIVLTSREKGEGERIPFCGVPHHSARAYWHKLVRQGFKIAIADQIEDPKLSKGLVKRDITRFITPALSDDLEFLDGSDHERFLAAILEDPKSKKWAICICDMSTGDFRAGECDDLNTGIRILQKYVPKELLLREFCLSNIQEHFQKQVGFDQLVFSVLSESNLRDKDVHKSLLTQTFSNEFLDSWWSSKLPHVQTLVASVLMHLVAYKQPISQFRTVKHLLDPECMDLDDVATRDLEIFETMRRRSAEGSLFHEICACQTPMGARRLRIFLSQPLLKYEHILARQQCVQSFVNKSGMLANFRANLSKIPDLDRLATRMIGQNITPNELRLLRTGLTELESLTQMNTGTTLRNAPLLDELISQVAGFHPLLSLLQSTLVEQPEGFGAGDKVFQLSHSMELNKWFQLKTRSDELIEKYETELRQSSGISSLKVRSHKSYGLLIEVTKSHLAKVPPHFMRRQSMVNSEKFTTPDLQKLSDELNAAQDQIIEIEQNLYQELLQKVSQEARMIQDLAKAIAEIDVYQSFAFKALKDNYVCPQTSAAGELHLVKSRHPVVERFVGKHLYTANDLTLPHEKKCVLITGPNMGGKSTFMRQMALTAVLHQVGSFVPAESAELPIFDAIFTRVGASDDLARGQSTFFIEMVETAKVLRNATARSLVILDEVGRGTSTTDGSAIAQAILVELSQKICCYTFFATHFHELVERTSHLSKLILKQTEVIAAGGQVKFSHRLIDGYATSSYGIDVARLAGIPESIIKVAGQLISQSHETEFRDFDVSRGALATKGSPTISGSTINPIAAPSLLPDNSQADPRLLEVTERLKGLKIQRTTPLSALNILNDLKLILDSEPNKQPGLWD